MLSLKTNIIMFLFLCCAFLSAAEKVVIERLENSEIQSITVNGDSLILKSNGKNYTFKFSELLSGKTVQAKKPVPKNLEEAFKYNSEWCFFNVVPSMRNRLCYMNNAKQSYRVFRRTTLLERVLYKNKYYARDLNKNIYRPDWGTKANFSPYLVPAKQYIKSLDNKIKSLEETTKKIEQKISEDSATVKANREKYIVFLQNNNLATTMIDKNGNIIEKQSSGIYTAKIKSQLRIYYKNIKSLERDIKKSTLNLSRLKSQLSNLIKLKLRSDALYKKYVATTEK